MKKELQDGLKKLGGRKVETFAGKVLSVNKDKGTCSVKDADLEYTDVQLAAIIKANGSRFYVFPKVGSSVIVSPINEDIHRLYVEAYSEVENVNIKIETTQMNIDANGMALERKGESLKQVLNDYIDEVNKIIVIEGTSINVAACNIIKQRLNKILK